MPIDQIHGNLIVKGNVYFIGEQMAASDTCNFNPLQPEFLLKQKSPFTKPITVQNYIGDQVPAAIDDTLAPDCWSSQNKNFALASPIQLHNVYCTGDIYATAPIRWIDKTGEPDVRTSPTGYIAGTRITPNTRSAEYPS